MKPERSPSRAVSIARHLAIGCALTLLSAGIAHAGEWGPLTLRERTTAPGQKQKFSFATMQSLEAAYLDPPLWVARGSAPGPTLCITAAVHGDELNGAEIARRAFAEIDPAALRGTVIALPIVNASGFRTNYRYMPDRRDLNRYFPGQENGSLAGFVAHAVFNEVITKCDALVDLHTGSLQRSNQPQIRVDLSDPEALAMARSFSVGVVLGGGGPKGSLRRAAMDAGIPTILYEAGAPDSFQEEHIAPGVQGLRHTMAHLGLLPALPDDHTEARVFTKTRWVRVPRLEGGFYFPAVALGTLVEPGDLLGTVTDFRTDVVHEITAPAAGEVIGMAIPQVVLSGYALFHLGTEEAGE